ncbi:hypothetical protein TRFO_16301 [Tritrichomonas foetus]|uniref:Condensation domain-containing protein n=1 Tax=Tritrichomonas foetus TaxID=1144522 RepID=A0A1J4KQ68_9EUKA|nr:hypothetical protein TRFO_16301 [Tritrichomonas foetus]|eukprot:OHT13449.1 hypothetical protein TRFO_16301 [Tritrichomonas foetus]
MSIIKTRPQTGFEKDFLGSGEIVQLALELDFKDIAPMIKKIENFAIGLRLKKDGNNLAMLDEMHPIRRIPDSIKNAQEAAEWAAKQEFDFDKQLSILSANDRFIVFNSSHAIADGGYLSTLLRSLTESGNSSTSKNASNLNEGDVSSFPLGFYDFFKDGIDQYKREKVVFNDIPFANQITRYNWHSTIPIEKFAKSKIADYITYIDKVEDYACYNKETKKCQSLTETQWTSLILAANACNQINQNDYDSKKLLGCSTCVDIRPLLPKNTNLRNVQNFFCVMNILCRNYSPDMTLAEFGKELRRFFNERNENSGLMEAIYCFYDGFPQSEQVPTYSIIETSNVGPQYIKPPIKDIWMAQSQPAINTDFGICLLSYGKKGKNVDDMIMRMRYSSRVVTHKDAKAIAESVRFFLKNMPQNTKFGEALNEIVKFQRQFH